MSEYLVRWKYGPGSLLNQVDWETAWYQQFHPDKDAAVKHYTALLMNSTPAMAMTVEIFELRQLIPGQEEPVETFELRQLIPEQKEPVVAYGIGRRFRINHDLNSRDVVVLVHVYADDREDITIQCVITRSSPNTVYVTLPWYIDAMCRVIVTNDTNKYVEDINQT